MLFYENNWSYQFAKLSQFHICNKTRFYKEFINQMTVYCEMILKSIFLLKCYIYIFKKVYLAK